MLSDLSMRRARELAERYTASELAERLVQEERYCCGWRDRANHAERALQNIVSGGWTAQGAEQVAREALAHGKDEA